MNYKREETFRSPWIYLTVSESILHQLSSLTNLDCMNLVVELTRYLRNALIINLSFDRVTEMAMKMNNCLRFVPISIF